MYEYGGNPNASSQFSISDRDRPPLVVSVSSRS